MDSEFVESSELLGFEIRIKHPDFGGRSNDAIIYGLIMQAIQDIKTILRDINPNHSKTVQNIHAIEYSLWTLSSIIGDQIRPRSDILKHMSIIQSCIKKARPLILRERLRSSLEKLDVSGC
ncbi:MAG: hypothetical protein EOP45_11055 [Sphingobacteriaceae bacterium]|nr:MAG: hypothetical protein EOP45_11055 [Sphingobacteriaceae bacterium]